MLCLDEEWESIAAESNDNLITGVQPANLAYIMYTSGSTGKPKGVLVPHQGLSNLAHYQIRFFDVQPTSRYLQFASLSFDPSISDIITSLCAGAGLYLIPPDSSRLGAELAELLLEYKITHIDIVPPALATISEDKLPDLRAIIVGGDVCTQELIRKWSQDRVFFNTYGPTEATVIATAIAYSDTDQKPSIGRPISNTQIYILDHFLQPVPIGVAGELYIGGTGVARGYLNRPELTAECFLPDPFSKENNARMYKTGDLARWLPNGEIEFIGRIDHQVKIRGNRIELAEIENALEKHSRIKQAIVLAFENPAGDKRLAAYTTSLISPPESSDLRKFLKKTLPDYMIPAAFVFLDTFPLTPNGKVDRRALTEPDSSAYTRTTNIVTPRNALEQQLADIWSEVLGISPVSIDDNFIDLGGHSLLALKVISLLKKRLQIDLPVRCLFDCPTIDKLARLISEYASSDTYSPLYPVAREQNIPLSFGQEQIWLTHQLIPEGTAYNLESSVHIPGKINCSALEKSLTELINRHEILRTTYPTIDGWPLQKIHSPFSFSLPVIDLRNFSKAEREIEVQRIAAKEIRKPFNLAEGPVLRAMLVRLEDTDTRLYLNMHHILADGGSINYILLPELEHLYTAFSQGKQPSLPELSIQYADFAVWQRNHLRQSIIAPQVAYWKEKLNNIPQLRLPVDRPRTSQTTSTGSVHEFFISKELNKHLKALSRSTGVTLFMTLVAAFKVLLYRYSAQEDIAIGTVSSQRNMNELDNIIGYFLNTLVLRSDLSGNPCFRELLERVKEVTLSAYAHQDVPFQRLVDAIRPDSHLGITPFFQAFFILQPPPGKEEASWAEIEVKESGATQFDLSFDMEERPEEGMIGTIEYNSDLFDIATIKQLAKHFIVLLEGIVADPDQKISHLQLLTKKEQHKLLIEWNSTDTEYPRNKCIHQLFEEQVKKTPDAVALMFKEQEVTYHELNCRANQLAHLLKKMTVGPEIPVGISVERSLEMVIGILAILKAGGAYVPIDPAYPGKRISYLIENSKISILLTQKHLQGILPEYQGKKLYLDQEWDRIAEESEENPISEVQPTNLAYIMYTSGSTGKPKGVLVPHQGLCNLAQDQIRFFNVQSTSRYLQFASLSFDPSISDIIMALCSGARLCLIPPESSRLGTELKELIQQYQITHIDTVPAALATIFDENLPNLQVVIVGGDVCTRELVREWSKGRKFINTYGPTECTVTATAVQYTDSDRRPTIGRPISNTRIYILDRFLQPVPIGAAGELYIGGIGVARGYLNLPETTAANFLPDPFSGEQNARMYKTGDLARYRPDGEIEFLGRIDHQVKIRGNRIELAEIENTLEKHPEVDHAIVLAHENTAGDKRLAAYTVLSENSQSGTDATVLRNFLKNMLPDYMIPAAFISLHTLPLTPNGKVDRQALPEPDASDYVREIEFVSPRNPLEQKLVSLWETMLNIKQIGIHDNFFHLGGNSLLAVRMLAELGKKLDRQLPVPILLKAPTVAQLAEALIEKEEAPPSGNALIPIQIGNSKYPFFFVPQGGSTAITAVPYARHLRKNQTIYGIQPLGFEEGEEPYAKIEDMAAYYVREIRKVQPNGPYYLGGPCFGSYVVFEMACQLQSQGCTVGLVAMLDPPDPPDLTNKNKDIGFYLRKFLYYIKQGKLFPALIDFFFYRRVFRIKNKIILLYNKLVPQVSTRLEDVLQKNMVLNAHTVAMDTYSPKFYPGKITIFRNSIAHAMEQKEDMFLPAKDWADFAAEIDNRIVEGNHMEIFEEPVFQQLIGELQTAIDEAQETEQEHFFPNQPDE
jgi:amino acid adenylation domain-containing protein